MEVVVVPLTLFLFVWSPSSHGSPDCEAEANGCDYRGSTLSTDCADGGVAEDEDSYVDSSDEDSDSKDTDVADADSATPSAMVGGTTAMILAASVSLAFASA